MLLMLPRLVAGMWRAVANSCQDSQELQKLLQLWQLRELSAETADWTGHSASA